MALANGSQAMSSLLADFVLLVFVLTSLFAVGIGACRFCTSLRGVDLIAYGVGAGVVIHALFGLSLAAADKARAVIVFLLFEIQVAFLIYLLRSGTLRELRKELSTPARAALAIWMLFMLACIAAIHLEVRFPATLPDGRYVFKDHSLGVKIQYLTSLPADNLLPYAVTEYFLRQIPFSEEHPILPAQEVSSRTILMSLVALPFRTALTLDHAPTTPHPFPWFEYVGRQWPDAERLGDDGSFQQFVVIGIALNSLLLLGAIAFCAHSCTRDVLLAGVAVIASNPYVLAQTIFTWPKAFAGFFILLGWNSLRVRRSPVIVALCAALAFHSHPFAIVFVFCFGLIYLVGSLPVKRFHAAAIYAGTVSLAILPWFIWTRFLGLPGGLVAQNFGTMHDAWSAPFHFLSIRFLNLASTLSPWRGQTLSVSAIADQSLTSLPGAVGAILIVPALIELCRPGEGRRLRTVGMFLPGLLLIGVFSNPALPVLHGFQPLVVPLVFFALSYLHRIASRSAFIALAGIQIACNCALVWAQMFLVGARFP